MKRLLLDTNIYGEMVIDVDFLKLKEEVHRKKESVIVYGMRLIRKELRDTPAVKKILKQNLRVALISLYDEFVADHNLEVDENKLIEIAKKYYGAYQRLGGSKSESELVKDYAIVACASLKKMDIVVSDDDSSMLSELSLKSYSLINESMGLINPSFIDYAQFKKLLLE